MTSKLEIRSLILDHLISIAVPADAQRLEDVRSGNVDIAFDDLSAFDSLDAVDLCTRLETVLDVPVDVAELARVSTVDAFAQRVVALCGSDDEPASDRRTLEELAPFLLCLKQGSQDTVPIFLFPGSDGSVYAFRELVAALPEWQSVYGLQPRGIDGEAEPPATIEDMAADFLRDIEAVVPDGPFWLVGYSGGGAVAFETASQFEAKGRREARIAMLDTMCPSTELPLLRWYQKILKPNFWEPAQLSLEISRFMERAKHGRKRKAERRAYRAALAKGGKLPRDVRPRHMITIFADAHRQYRPDVIQSDILLFRATIGPISKERGGRSLGWAPRTGGEVEVVEIEATHGSIYLGRHARTIAGILAGRTGAAGINSLAAQ